jgi:hypothetical protein
MDKDLAARLEAIEQQLHETSMFATWLMSRFCVPALSYVDKLMAEQYLERKIAERCAAAEPPPHLKHFRSRPSGE